jgi:hypothetical protein
MNDTRPCYFCHEPCRRHKKVVTMFVCDRHEGVSVHNYYNYHDFNTFDFLEMNDGKYLTAVNYRANYFSAYAHSNHEGHWVWELVLSFDYVPPNITPENISSKISMWILLS